MLAVQCKVAVSLEMTCLAGGSLWRRLIAFSTVKQFLVYNRPVVLLLDGCCRVAVVEEVLAQFQ